MNRQRTGVLVMGVLAVAAGAVWVGGRSGGKTVRLTGGPVVTTDTTRYTLRPVGQNEVNGSILPVKLPAEAVRIQFAEYSEYVAYEQFVRFEAPPEVCTAYATTLLDAFNKGNPVQAVPAELVPIHEPGHDKATSSELPTLWFTPEGIQRGLEGGGREGHQPKVWVDLDKGVFYYQCLD